MSKVDAIILAGGKGTRLQSVVKEVPKPLAAVEGRPFVEYQLDILARSGLVGEVVLSLGYLADKVVEHFESAPPPLPMRWVVEETPLGTGGGARLAVDGLAAGQVLVINGDSMFEWDVAVLSQVLGVAGVDAVMALVEVDDVGRYGSVAIEGDRIVRFVEKGEVGGQGLINAGLLIFNRAVVEAWPKGEAFSLERDMLPGMASGGRLGYAVFRSKFIDIGLPETYAAARYVVPGLMGAGT